MVGDTIVPIIALQSGCTMYMTQPTALLASLYYTALLGPASLGGTSVFKTRL